MLLVNQTLGFADRVGLERAVDMNKRAGFDALDLSMLSADFIERMMQDDWRDFAAEIRAISDKYDIPFVQAHAPFRFRDAYESCKSFDQVYRGVILPQTVRAMELAAAVGVEIIVVHPIHRLDYHMYRDEIHDRSIAYYRELIPHCERLGIRVALENMFQCRPHTNIIEADACSNPYEFVAWLDELDSIFITGCLDIGHCGLVGEDACECIRIIGAEKLGCLHVHDNDYIHDSHTLPGLGKLDWNAVTKALGDIGYRGNFTYEACSFPPNFADEVLPSVAQLMHDVGRELISRIG